MLDPTSSTHFSCSLKFGNSIIVNVLVALDEILQGDYRLNYSY